MDHLRHEIHIPEGARDGSPALVLLHGRGADRHDLLGLADRIPDDTVLVTPEAPHPGGPWGYGPGWAWYRYLGEDRVETESLDVSLESLARFLARLDDLLPWTPDRIVLGGFSQGGTTSLAYALRHPGSVAGVMVLSGFLANGVLEKAPEGAAPRLRLFWGHGTADLNIPHALAEEGRGRLREAGADVMARDYPMGHGISPDEWMHATAWVQSLDEL